jgi:hypothetical protein
MALNEKKHRWHPRRKRKGSTAELSARLAPLEEQTPKDAKPATNGDGSIIIKSENLNLPKGLIEEQKEEQHWFRLEPVVIVILLIMLSFIAFIAWKISEMPDPPK